MSLATAACTAVTLSPETPALNTPFVLPGTIEFEGDDRYLPTALRGGADPDNEPVLHYEYDVEVDDADFNPIAVLFNPLTLLGFPTGTTEITVVGTLRILVEGEPVETYTARYHYSKTRSVYSSRDLSTPRSTGLIRVRDRIDDQLRRDAEHLSRYVAVGAGPEIEGRQP